MGLFKKVFKKSGAEPLSLTGGLASKPASPAGGSPIPNEEIVLSESAPGAEPAAKGGAPVGDRRPVRGQETRPSGRAPRAIAE